ncbi:hypothetical protein [Streptomyces sp. NBC_00019]|uniref:hypothetical protein n=1 Tax=Streptomyces sp. NBC_00019 TaxID=2975623 RepID=UPI0032548E23
MAVTSGVRGRGGESAGGAGQAERGVQRVAGVGRVVKAGGGQGGQDPVGQDGQVVGEDGGVQPYAVDGPGEFGEESGQRFRGAEHPLAW